MIKIQNFLRKTPFGPSPQNDRGWNLKNQSHTITHTQDHYVKISFGSVHQSKRKVAETYVSTDRRRRLRRHCHNIIRLQIFCGRIKSGGVTIPKINPNLLFVPRNIVLKFHKVWSTGT